MTTNDLATLIIKQSRHRPDAIALQLDDVSLTWADLQREVQSYARQLQRQGMTSESRVLVVGRNQWELVHLYLSCLWLGAACTIVNRFPLTELTRIAKQIGATHYRTLAGEAKPLSLPQVAPYDAIHSDAASIEPQEIRLASIVLSSGSTGIPKAITHTARAHIESARGVCELMQWHNADNCLLSLPLYHVSGLAMIWRWLYSGCCLSISEAPQQLLYPVTITSMVATQLQRWLKAPYSQSLKVLLGGSYIDPQLVNKATQAGATCFVGYAMSEMASTICAKHYDGHVGVGKALLNREVSLIGSEIAVRGAMLSSGSLIEGQLVPLPMTNGWYLTKDLGEVVDDQWQVLGRKDNAFMSGGENIHCEEVEKALLSTGHFEQVMVVPIEDAEFGHRPVALYASEGAFSRQATETKLSSNLIKFKWPVAYFAIPDQFLEGVKLNRKQLQQWLVDLKLASEK